MMRKKIGIAIMVVVFMMAICGVGYDQVNAKSTIDNSKYKEAPRINNRAPSFELSGLDNNNYHVGGPRNKLLLINFWASWCEPCHMEAGHLQSIYSTYQDRLDLYAVNATYLDSQAGAVDFVLEHELTYPILMDRSGKITRDKYWMEGYPTSYLINQAGVIKKVYFGVVDKLTLERDIRKLLQ